MFFDNLFDDFNLLVPVHIGNQEIKHLDYSKMTIMQ